MKKTGRPGVVVYFELRPALHRLTREQQGSLFCAILDYGDEGLVPQFDDMTLQVLWEVIQPRLDADNERYMNVVEARREAANRRWSARAKGANASPAMQTMPDSSFSPDFNPEGYSDSGFITTDSEVRESPPEDPCTCSEGDDSSGCRGGSFPLPRGEIPPSPETFSALAQAAHAAGLPFHEMSSRFAAELAEKYGLEEVLEAIRIMTVGAQKPSWRFVEGVLKRGVHSEKPKTGMTTPWGTGKKNPLIYSDASRSSVPGVIIL